MLRSAWHEAFPTLAGQSAREAFERAFPDRTPVELESYDESAQRWYLIKAHPMRDGGLAVLIQDITVRRRTEEALREADRRKDEFLATLAHELRNPLAPIRNAAADPASRAARPMPELQWARDIIDRQVHHMARLVDDLLDVSRITPGQDRAAAGARRRSADVVAQRGRDQPAADRAARARARACSLPPEPLHVDGDLDAAGPGVRQPAQQRRQVHRTRAATSG